MSKLEKGAVVRLKSGGPDMTYTGKDDSSRKKAFCQWFVGGNKLESGWFTFESLEVVAPA